MFTDSREKVIDLLLRHCAVFPVASLVLSRLTKIEGYPAVVIEDTSVTIDEMSCAGATTTEGLTVYVLERPRDAEGAIFEGAEDRCRTRAEAILKLLGGCGDIEAQGIDYGWDSVDGTWTAVARLRFSLRGSISFIS